MIKLYSNGCPLCRVVTKHLQAKNKSFHTVDVDEDTATWLHAKGHRELPVLVSEDEMEYTGHDALVAIMEGEV